MSPFANYRIWVFTIYRCSVASGSSQKEITHLETDWLLASLARGRTRLKGGDPLSRLGTAGYPVA
jgi:hypothetical protein